MHKYCQFLFCLLLLIVQVEASHAIPDYQPIENYEAQYKVDRVMFLIQKRLSVMHEVARTKWNQKIAIEDLVREKQILEGLVLQGDKYGLDGKWLQQFFQAQMDAAKMIQNRDFALWTDQGKQKFDHVLDLKNEIRPYLDQLTGDLLEALSHIQAHIVDDKVKSYVSTQPILNRPSDSIEESVWQMAIAPLL